MTKTPLTFAEVFGLPLVLDLRTAAKALGICPATAYRLIRSGAFPCTVLRVGHHYRIPTALLMEALGVEEVPVLAEDIESGVVHAQTIEEEQ
ncbi:helix-turn-helix domain-containing protein [Thermomonospora cellulosilytica]|uniref:Excisionase family DNA binding protein n=1 Tax=Thermomonospora cellulosilytica TaxID=1411118 RepID=A0A7W3MW55_9ACTN|nr:helix-turn-helix domain-containing protein [Thermomonospora cellulosilytica]MBA9003025.1 excisionase family DNA binding protein [Thermomonospora cellulosilytica]